MKTAKEILREVGVWDEILVIKAMEKYAEQFKPKKHRASQPPIHHNLILIRHKNGYIEMGIYSRTGKFINQSEGEEITEVKYWMEVPE